jgi:sugar (pentulose or hexulose) kinase
MGTPQPVFLGVDVGTQGIRAVAVDPAGTLLSSHRAGIPLRARDGIHEQSPDAWWRALLPLLTAVAADLRTADPAVRPLALSVTSTSGTVIPLAADHMPVHPALMYDDTRAADQARRCRVAATDAGWPEVAFGTSYGLPKILWFMESHPAATERIAAWAHAADYVVGRLSGAWGVTDLTNALKTGFDPQSGRWPEYITGALQIPASWLPRVLPSGTPVGSLLPDVAAESGLAATTVVTTGMTDGCASQIAAGAVGPGEWNTTIGTTMVVKGVTRQPVPDPLGRLYNHRHPDGWWMPGGASNTGADWVARDFAASDLTSLDNEARAVIPTPWIVYPLTGEGERFPFIAPAAKGFEPHGLSETHRFAARMEGVAYLERLAYELIEELSGETVDRVFSAGGGSRGETWSLIRANILQKPVLRMCHPEAAVGAAILAASRTSFASLETAARAMTTLARAVEPGDLAEPYAAGYARFVAQLRDRGYLDSVASAV